MISGNYDHLDLKVDYKIGEEFIEQFSSRRVKVRLCRISPLK